MNLRQRGAAPTGQQPVQDLLELTLISCVVLLAGAAGLQGFESVLTYLPNYLIGKVTHAPLR